METPSLADQLEAIGLFCERWEIVELALFGSALREDFHSQSDLDFLATFSVGANWSLFDLVEMESELKSILGRDVDLFTKAALTRSRNWIRKGEISRSARVIYQQETGIDVPG